MICIFIVEACNERFAGFVIVGFVTLHESFALEICQVFEEPLFYFGRFVGNLWPKFPFFLVCLWKCRIWSISTWQGADWAAVFARNQFTVGFFFTWLPLLGLFTARKRAWETAPSTDATTNMLTVDAKQQPRRCAALHPPRPAAPQIAIYNIIFVKYE